MENQVKPLFQDQSAAVKPIPVAPQNTQSFSSADDALDSLFDETPAQAVAQPAQVQSSFSPVAPAAPATPVQNLSPLSKALINLKKTESAPASFKGLQYKLLSNPDYGLVEVQVPANQTLKVEASSMAYMTSNISMKTKLRGGFGRFLTGESIFMNEFTSSGSSGEIGIAPAQAGAVDHVYLENQTMFLQNSAFLASSMNITVESKWQGFMKGFFSGESLFLIKCSGTGDLWFNSYGAIIQIDVEDEYVVDTSYIVGFSEGLDYNVESVGGMKSLFFSGEGLVCRFRGRGKLWIQTRSVTPFLSWLHPFRPVSSN